MVLQDPFNPPWFRLSFWPVWLEMARKSVKYALLELKRAYFTVKTGLSGQNQALGQSSLASKSTKLLSRKTVPTVGRCQFWRLKGPIKQCR